MSVMIVQNINALVTCNHCFPAPGNSGDVDFLSSKTMTVLLYSILLYIAHVLPCLLKYIKSTRHICPAIPPPAQGLGSWLQMAGAYIRQMTYLCIARDLMVYVSFSLVVIVFYKACGVNGNF